VRGHSKPCSKKTKEKKNERVCFAFVFVRFAYCEDLLRCLVVCVTARRSPSRERQTPPRFFQRLLALAPKKVVCACPLHRRPPPLAFFSGTLKIAASLCTQSAALIASLSSRIKFR
jgi:hypothetical protein